VNTTLNVVESISTGIADEALPEELLVFPNPAMDVLRVEGTAAADQQQVFIMDASGRLVQESPLRNGVLDVSRLAPGNYVLQLLGDGKFVSRKFTKG
jgi:hypothetical protein